jgi:hypothetical protein
MVDTRDLTFTLSCVSLGIWGQRYERKMSEITGLQQQLSRDIATNLRIRLAGDEENRILHRYSASPAAYELYLKGRFFWGDGQNKACSKGSIISSRRSMRIPITLSLTLGWRTATTS